MANSIDGMMARKMVEDYENSQKKYSPANYPITVEKVKALALKHYNSGGDSVVECWEDYQILDAINKEGMTTEADWLAMFRFVEAVTEDIRNS